MTTKNGEENIVDQKKYELLLSLKERNIRMKQKLLWEENKQLLSEDKLYYTSKEKELIKQLLYNPIPPEYRKEYWFIITGAKLEYKNNPGYYQSLQKLLANNTNFPFIKTITLDMHRTFPHMETFKKEENLTKLSNILKAFALRNCSSIAYCQGFNYIAAQLLLVMEDEEKVFWTFTKIIEDYLPFDFYLKFTGVRADMAIMHSILVKKLDYIDKNEELNLCINNLVSRCFISLYSEIVEIEILRNIWDIFFVYGNVILFRTFNFIASLLFDKKFKKYNIETVHEELTQKLHQIKGNDLLNYFLLIERNINSSFIEANRRIKRHQVYKQNSQFVETVGDPSNKCDLNSPYCYFNNIINDINKFSEYKIFRLKQNTKKFDNYFLDKFKEDNIDNNNNENTIKNEICIDSFDDILIERMEHVCNKVKDENIETKKE
jgi:hypothetical protein